MVPKHTRTGRKIRKKTLEEQQLKLEEMQIQINHT